MRKIEKIFQLFESQNIKPATFERDNDLGNGYLKKVLDSNGDITDKMLKRIEKHSKNFYEQIEGRPPGETIAQSIVEESVTEYQQPIIQVVLNLSYTSKRNADSMDKMAATNQRNTEIIAALVNTLIPNSKLVDESTPLPGDLSEADEVPSIEEMLGPEGVALLREQWQAGKKKVQNK